MAGIRSEKLLEVQARLQRLGVREEDLVEKFVRAAGKGGQKVNKTSVAVYLRHVPTGIEVKSQTSRSQAMNRVLARRRLAERMELQHEEFQLAEEQRIEKIRRQKRKRSKRAKEKMLATKRTVGEKKRNRARVSESDS